MKILFIGEMMDCCLCPSKEKSDPANETQWRAIEWGVNVYYVCPKHFPPDGSGSGKFKLAYDRVFKRIISLENAKSVRNVSGN